MTSKLTGTMQQMATFMAHIAHCPSPNKDELSITFDQLLKYLNPISFFFKFKIYEYDFYPMYLSAILVFKDTICNNFS